MNSEAKAKTINLLLEEGSLGGLIFITDSMWNSGEMYSVPRESSVDLLNSDACKKYGVYLLLSDNMVYVGQASDLSRRIKQHIMGKDWWERVVVLTTSDDNLTRTDIDYLESELIAKAEATDKLDCDNRNKGNRQKIDKFRKVVLNQYLEEALFLIELIGITVFKKTRDYRTKNETLIQSIQDVSSSDKEIRAKREAKNYLAEKGIKLLYEFSYGKLQEKGNMFWLNPNIKLLENNWTIVLNNQNKSELIIMDIPAGELALQNKSSSGLLVRKDKPDRIDLTIDANSFIDKRSKIDFSKYITKRLDY